MGAQRHPQSCTGGPPPHPWLLHTHMGMPSGFTPPCLAKGRARLNARRVVRKGRSSLWLVNLISLSDLQQRQLEGAALTHPGVPASDPGWIRTLGHQGTAAQHVLGVTGAGRCPVAARCPGCGVWHHCCGPDPRPRCSLAGELTAALQPSGCPRSGDTAATGLTGAPQCRICVTCARGWPHVSPPRHGRA